MSDVRQVFSQFSDNFDPIFTLTRVVLATEKPGLAAGRGEGGLWSVSQRPERAQERERKWAKVEKKRHSQTGPKWSLTIHHRGTHFNETPECFIFQIPCAMPSISPLSTVDIPPVAPTVGGGSGSSLASPPQQPLLLLFGTNVGFLVEEETNHSSRHWKSETGGSHQNDLAIFTQVTKIQQQHLPQHWQRQIGQHNNNNNLYLIKRGNHNSSSSNNNALVNV